MSALRFNSYCCQCFQSLLPKSGIVLSCGDFICSSCSDHTLQNGLCPACHEAIQSAPLDNPPDEILKTIEDPSDSIEATYNQLKFQLTHYKTMLGRASNIIQQQRRQLDKLDT